MEDFLGIHSDGSVDDFPALEEDVIRTEYDVEPAPPPYEPFKDLCKRRFLWYYDTYMATLVEGEKSTKKDQDFVQMPFEGGGNTMAGKFHYPELKRRIELIKVVLLRETDYWAREGALEVRKDTSVAAMMNRQFEPIHVAFDFLWTSHDESRRRHVQSQGCFQQTISRGVTPRDCRDKAIPPSNLHGWHPLLHSQAPRRDQIPHRGDCGSD